MALYFNFKLEEYAIMLIRKYFTNATSCYLVIYKNLSKNFAIIGGQVQILNMGILFLITRKIKFEHLCLWHKN